MSNPLCKQARLRIRGVLQGLVSVGLLAWLASTVSWSELYQTLIHASLPWLLLSAGLYYIGVAISCSKWQLTLRAEGLSIPWQRLVGWYLIGAFANNFLPSAVGGDLGRAFYAGRYTGQFRASARSIVVERGSGYVILLGLALVGLVRLGGLPVVLLVGALSACGLGCGWLVLWQFGSLPQWLLPLREWLQTSLRIYVSDPHRLVALGGYSLLFHVLAGLSSWCNLFAVDVYLPFAVVLLVVAMTNVLGALPIAVNGWGVREAAFIGLLTAFQTANPGVLAGLILGRGLQLLLTLPGVVSLLLERKQATGLQPSSTV